MNYIGKSIAILLLASFATSSSAQLTDTERAAIAAEITAALQNCHRVFSTGTASEMVDQICGLPLLPVF